MTADPSEAFELVAGLRISQRSDSLGIPLFAQRRSNSWYVPETDAKLRITSFETFDVDDSPPVSPILSFEGIAQFYHVGDAVPIPVWRNNATLVISSAAPMSSVTSLFGADTAIARRLERTLKKVSMVEQEDRAEDMAQQFWKFLQQPPLADRYWVDHFRTNLSQIASSGVGLDNIMPEYSRLALMWATKCAPKAELRVITDFVDGLSKHGKYHRGFLEAQGLALMKQVVARPSSSRQLVRLMDDVARNSDAPSVIEAVMHGAEPSKETDETYWLLTTKFQDALLRGRKGEIESYSKLFGRSTRLPEQISSTAYAMLHFKIKELVNSADRVLGLESHTLDKFVLRSIAESALEDAKLVETIHRLLNPEDANADIFRVNWTGIDRETLGDLESIAKGQPLVM